MKFALVFLLSEQIDAQMNSLMMSEQGKFPNVEGQNAIDMAPLQPHTISKHSRSCESCHSMPKAMGLGISGLKNTIIVDEQMPAITNLHYDYSKFLDENGKQLQTVGHHWSLSAPLSKEQR